MTGISKTVRRRLSEAAQGADHPDPDLLTAFVEKTLREQERTQVLAHVATCADCRDIVFLSAPSVETTQAAGVTSRSVSLGWPVLRWAAAVACVVVVGAAVTLRYRPQSEKAALTNAPQNEIKAPVANYANKKESVASANDEKSFKAIVAPPSTQPASRATSTIGDLTKERRVEGAATAGKTHFFPTETADTQRQVAALAAKPEQAPVLAPPAPAARAKIQAGAASAGAMPGFVAGETVSVQADAVKVQTADATPQNNFGKSADKHQATTMSIDSGQDLPMENRNLVALMNVARDASVVASTWTFSSDGVLQRSLDAGKTWSPVKVPAHKTVLRVVTAVGPHVWVGGAKGALYHSIDFGQHWLRVKPSSADGKKLGSDIQGIEFSSLQQGKVTTSGGEVWSTSDSGQHWQRN